MQTVTKVIQKKSHEFTAIFLYDGSLHKDSGAGYSDKKHVTSNNEPFSRYLNMASRLGNKTRDNMRVEQLSYFPVLGP